MHEILCQNDKVLGGRDLLRGLVRTVHKFLEGPIVLQSSQQYAISIFRQFQYPNSLVVFISSDK